MFRIIHLLALIATIETLVLKNVSAGNARPEVVLLDVLAKPFVPTEGASAECLRDSTRYLEDLNRYVPWALQMYDASSKIPAGVITGNYRQLGNYDECLRLESGYGFVGQSCTATIRFDVAADDGLSRDPDIGDVLLGAARASNVTDWTFGSSVLYEWTWCVPSTCNHSEIKEALEIALDPLKVEGRVDLIVWLPEKSCRTWKTDKTTMDIADWSYSFLLIFFVIIIIISTTYDVTMKCRETEKDPKASQRKDLLASFSVRVNWMNLSNTKRHKDSIGCLDGLRYLSICWIIYGHTYYSEVMATKIDLTSVPRMHHDWSNMLVLNGNIATDIFFLLSGILLAYTETIKERKNPERRFNVISLYVHRYLRLTPAYAMMIGFYATLFYKTGSGPKWEETVGSNRDFCRENWWTNLLYVNNYVNVPTMCISQSWYLATDMQLFWLSPIFLYPMLKFKRAVFFWILVLSSLLLSAVIPFVVTYYLGLTGTMLYYKGQIAMADVFLYVYTRTYNRAGPYIIGLALGHILYTTRSRGTKIPRLYVICGWIVSIVIGASVIFGPVGMYEERGYNKIEASFYAGLHRHVFASAVAWIVFAAVHGYGGIVARFLSWPGWMPLSKLTYGAYLCHYVFILSDSGSIRTSGTLTRFGVIHVYFGYLVLTMALSAIWSLCFEFPFAVVERELRSRWQTRKEMNQRTSKSSIRDVSRDAVINAGYKVDDGDDEPSVTPSEFRSDKIHNWKKESERCAQV